jgi:hypothetical protein
MLPVTCHGKKERKKTKQRGKAGRILSVFSEERSIAWTVTEATLSNVQSPYF